MNIIIPFNGIMPKGEVGINPAYPDLKYKVYIGNVHVDNADLFVRLEKEVEINIVPKLVDIKFSFMRNRDF